MPATRLSGVWAPAITPFRAGLAVDPERFACHARWLLANGCTGLAVFGTNSEANSLTVEERIELLEHLLAAGIPSTALMPGTGCCALADSVRLSAHATSCGCAGVLMLPPFYYKGVSDEGLFRVFSEVIERVGDARLRLYLYHIPPVSQVPISLALVERLLARYPGAVAGIKDSSGDWNNTRALIDNFSGSGFNVFAGSEVFLLQTMRQGGAGCISATANVNPGAIARLFDTWRGPDADAQQQELAATRARLQKYPMIAALKATVAHFLNDTEWMRMRPPLVELNAAEQQALVADLVAHGFDMPRLERAAEAL